MASSPYQNLGNLRVAIVNDAKEATSAALVAQVNRWINEGYEQVILRKKREWLDNTLSYQVSSAVQAVCQVVKNSTSITFPSSVTLPVLTGNAGYIFYNTGYNEVYQINGINGQTINISTAYTGSSNTAASGVIAQNFIKLETSFRHVYKSFHNFANEPMIEVGPQKMVDIKERYGPQLDYAAYCTIFGQQSSDGKLNYFFYPYPFQTYNITLNYNQYVTPLSADSDEPRIPMQHRQILYHYGMYKLFSYHRNEAKAAEALTNFNTMLAKIDGETKPEADFPKIMVSYKRGSKRTFFPSFDNRYREDP